MVPTLRCAATSSRTRSHNTWNWLRSALCTFNQWRDRGGRVMRRPNDVPPGEWGCGIIYYCPITKIVSDPTTGEESEEKYPLLKTYSVFSVDQVEGDHLDHLRARDEGPVNLDFVDFEPAEVAITATEADIRYTGDRAFYCRGGDYIQVPPKGKFPKESEFYAVCLHELAHWSEKRTDWTGDYPVGELRAEIAASYMLAELGVPQSSDMSNHQAYLKNWLQALRNDNRSSSGPARRRTRPQTTSLVSPDSPNPKKCRSEVGGRVTARGGGVRATAPCLFGPPSLTDNQPRGTRSWQ